MEARVADLPAAERPPGVTIEEVRDEAGHRLWAATLRAPTRAPPAASPAASQAPASGVAMTPLNIGHGIPVRHHSTPPSSRTTPPGRPPVAVRNARRCACTGSTARSYSRP